MIFTHFRQTLIKLLEFLMVVVFFIGMSIFMVVWTILVLLFLLILIIGFLISKIIPLRYLFVKYVK